jgi:two-component system sensor histidine kinase KdpD
MVAVVTGAGKAFPFFDLINISLLYLLPVLIAAVRWGLWPSLAASFLGMLCFDYFFIPPFLSFTVDDIRHLLNFLIFLVVAVATGTLAARLRVQADEARERERRGASLYALSHRIAVETEMRPILQAVVDMVAASVNVSAAILMPGTPYNRLTTIVHSGAATFTDNHRQIAAAQFAFEHAGRAAQEASIFFPISEGKTSLGVLAVACGPEETLTAGQERDLEAFAALTALAITRIRLSDEAERAKWLLESEKLHTALLNAVSHDLRTPLSSIRGAVTGLLTEGNRYDAQTRTALLNTINEGAQRMNRFVANLLDMARIESGILKANREWCDILDVVGIAVKEVRDIVPERRLTIKAPDELPLVQMDFGLIEQVLINLLENAAKYSPADSPITLTIETGESDLVVSVTDHAPPIPPDEREHVFEKFYRLRSSRHVSGTGLGLSICKAMIDAHGGTMRVEAAPGGGNMFIFTLPFGGARPPGIPAEPEERHDH